MVVTKLKLLQNGIFKMNEATKKIRSLIKKLWQLRRRKAQRVFVKFFDTWKPIVFGQRNGGSKHIPWNKSTLILWCFSLLSNWIKVFMEVDLHTQKCRITKFEQDRTKGSYRTLILKKLHFFVFLTSIILCNVYVQTNSLYRIIHI